MERSMKIAARALCMVVLAVWCIACGGPSSGQAREGTETDASSQHPAGTLSEQCHIRYARGFTVTYHNGYKVVTVYEPGRAQKRNAMSTFVLVPRGTHPRVTVAGTVVEVPVRRAVARSASHVPFFSMLGLADRIVGVVQGKYVNDPETAELIRRGRVVDVGLGSGMTAQFNVERLLTLHPDFILSWWTNNPAYAAHIKVREAGLHVVLAADYEENTALGRTEWMKFVAVFFNAEAEAERVFNGIESRYLAVRDKAAAVRHRPTVMYGSSYQGSWYVAGGKSFFANLAKDAGGRYVWPDNDFTGSRPVNIESAMMRGRDADYWFTQSQNHFSLASLAAEDARYRLFRAFQAGHIYSNNGRIGPGGGNDYYQGTVARPDLLLADMIAILHPELLPDHKLIWHVHLPAAMSDGGGRTKGTEE